MRNARSDHLDLTVDRCHALEAEVSELTARLEAVTAELDDERSYSATLKRLVERAKERINELETDGGPTGEAEQGGSRFSEADLAGGEPGPAIEAAAAMPEVPVIAEPAAEPGVDLSFTKGRSAKRRMAKVRRQAERAERAEKRRRTSKRSTENVYVFDDQDETRVAFDEFFNEPDPHLDKVRGFLLD
ncbi:MAG: hypothetical protein AAGA65_15185 [Actinomycetota bacterium]